MAECYFIWEILGLIGNSTGSITSFWIEQKVNIVIRCKILSEFIILSDHLLFGLKFCEKFSLLLAFVQFQLVAKPYHYFNCCYHNIRLLFYPKLGYASCAQGNSKIMISTPYF